MGSDQSNIQAGGQGSTLKSQRDEDIPYTTYSISKPIDGESPRQSPRLQNKGKSTVKQDKEITSKHDIVVVAEGQVLPKDPDHELTRLNTIPVFYPILRGSLNMPTSTRDIEVIEKLDYRQLLLLALRYQDHLKQLADAVSFDQNALCIRIKEIDCAIHMLQNILSERQKKYSKCTEHFQRTSETLAALNKIQEAIDTTIPKMERLNELLPPEHRLEPFSMKATKLLLPEK